MKWADAWQKVPLCIKRKTRPRLCSHFWGFSVIVCVGVWGRHWFVSHCIFIAYPVCFKVCWLYSAIFDIYQDFLITASAKLSHCIKLCIKLHNNNYSCEIYNYKIILYNVLHDAVKNYAWIIIMFLIFYITCQTHVQKHQPIIINNI